MREEKKGEGRKDLTKGGGGCGHRALEEASELREGANKYKNSRKAKGLYYTYIMGTLDTCVKWF